MLKIAYSEVYKYNLPPGHRFPMDKYELLPQQLLYEGTISKENLFHPPKLADEEILLTHTPSYLDDLNGNLLSAKEGRKIGFPILPALIERGKHIANGTLMCARYAMIYGVSLNVAGGTHHAFADRGEGFCVFNDIAIASNVLLFNQEVSKIMIIDLDVHQGNGTASIFEGDDRVYTFSMHGAKNYPLRKESSDMDIGLQDGTTDDHYLSKVEEMIPTLLEIQNPDIIFYLAGVDIIDTDRLGRLNVSKSGCMERDRLVLAAAQNKGIPVAVVMGGGYSPQIKDIIDAHANTFRVARSLYF